MKGVSVRMLAVMCGVVLAVSACGSHQETVPATTVLDEAAERAKAQVSPIKEVVFEDQGQPVFPGTVTKAGEVATSTDTAANAGSADSAQTQTETDEASPDTATTPASDADKKDQDKTDTEKPSDKPDTSKQ